MQEDTKGETMHRKLEGNMVNMLTKLDPNLYRKYIHTKGNNPIVYVELKKALYGTLQADLMFQKNLTTLLQEWDFDINPQDWCVANKTVNDKQLTLVWHVDDLKVSHVDSPVVSNLLELLNYRYGEKCYLTI